MNKTLESKIIEAVQKQALELQPIIKDRPEFVKDNIYEIVLLNIALLNALDNNADTIFDEISYLTSKAWMDVGL